MEKRLLCFFLFFIIIASAALSAPTNSEKSKLGKIQKELKEKKAKLLQTKKKEQKSLSQLVQIKRELKQTRRQLNQAYNKISVNEQQLSQLKNEISETEILLKDKGNKLNSRIREVYKNNSVNYLDLLFSARNMSDFINRSYFFSKIVETDVNLINVVSEQYKASKEKRDKLTSLASETKRLASTISRKKKKIDQKKSEEQQVYSSLKTRRKEYERKVAELQKSSEELTKIIQTKVAEQSKGPVSKKGTGVLIWPIRGRITSRFGYRRHPYWGGRNWHTGLDIAAPYGRPIKAADGGKVILARWWGGYGKAVVINHGNNTTTVYGHMSRIYVQIDNNVAKGQIIGLIGSTGFSTGPHLHFEVRKNGKPKNPIKYLP